MRFLISATAFLYLLSGPATATEVNDLLTRHLYAGTLSQGGSEMESFTQSGDKAVAAEAQAARGILEFVSSIEKLGQALHRHGLQTPQSAMMQLPILRLPVPPNPNPEQLDYPKYRAILRELLDGLIKAEATLAAADGAGVKFAFDLLKVRLDLDGDGKAGDHESLGAMMRQLMRASDPVSAEMLFTFDAADILWLRGYSQFIMAAAQFGLAHDFHQTFDKTFHVFFPNAGLPLAIDLTRQPSLGRMPSEAAIGDFIAFIHLFNWPVMEPERLADSRLRLKAIAQLSRESWQAARAETDNDREWLPNAKQTGTFASLPASDATIDGWLAVMKEFELVLDGEKLLPHWRFDRGLNVKRLFTESKNFDLVLLLAGTDAVPYLEDGPISTTADWDNLTSVFRGNFLGYAIWYN